MIKTGMRLGNLPEGDLFILVSRGGSALGRQFAPDFASSEKYRNGEITWDQYMELYKEKLQRMWDSKAEAMMTVARFVHDDPRTLWILGWERENSPQCYRKILHQFLLDHTS